MDVIKKIPVKICPPPRPALQGHSQGHRNRHRSIRQRPITTKGLSRTVSEINGDFSLKSQFFSHPPLLNGFPRPWNWVPALWVKN